MTKVIAFGAGNFFESRKTEIEKEYDIVVFCDSDIQKKGTLFNNKKVISVEELDCYPDFDILITSRFKYEIIEQLLEIGVDENKIHVIKSEWMENTTTIRVRGGGIELCRNGITVILCNELEEMIFREIWYLEEYNVNLNSDSIVLDVGLNVGFAALFFANKEFVKKVYAFEPDRVVYDKALLNIKLNKKISDKIETFNVACADKYKKETYIINPNISAGMLKQRGGIDENYKTVSVECVDSACVFGAIIDEHYGKNKIIMKCDCEGAEYEIFNRLEESGYFNKIDVFVMEWHAGRRKEIEEIFHRNKYVYMIYTTPGRTFGKCYAVKQLEK